MTQAQEAYAVGKLAEAETLAKRAQEVDPDAVGSSLDPKMFWLLQGQVDPDSQLAP